VPKKGKVYGVADKAWQPVVGCDPRMACAPRCWARKTVARIVKCQGPVSPERAAFFQIALTPDGEQWSGNTYLDSAHFTDPLKWRNPAVIATGFHGDWGRLCEHDMLVLLQQIGKCPRHTFMMLTKQPMSVFNFLAGRRWRNFGHSPAMGGDFHVAVIPGESVDTDVAALKNVTIGCSVMNQAEADKMRAPMKALGALGWRTHVWYEPALGPVDWTGWEFVERIIYGGESGNAARPNDIDWARSTLKFSRRHKIAFVMKQLGSDCREGNANGNCRNLNCTHPDCGYVRLPLRSRKGDDLESIPADLRVRESPSTGPARPPDGGRASNSSHPGASS
jgi:protein gp37